MMPENVAKGFKVPKIKRQENKDNLRQVEVTSRDAKEIINIVNHSYLDSNYRPAWELKSVHLIENRELEERYRQKKLAMKDGQKRETLPEQFAFLLLRDDISIPDIVKNGMKCGNLAYNSLGDSKMGVYVMKNADIQLRMAELWSVSSCTVLVFKVTLGKCKALPGQLGDETIEPTPNYDCHIHQSQPKACNPLHIQLNRSQIYLYEYTDDCEPAPYPRQCLPYAILRYDRTATSAPQVPVDSYSRRTVKAPEVSRQEPTESTTSKKSESKSRSRDPRIPTPDPRLAYQQLDNTSGLCVPRLTGGPSLAETHTKVTAPLTSETKITHSGDPKLVLQQLQKDPRLAKSQKDPRLAGQGPLIDPRLSVANVTSVDPRLATGQIPAYSAHQLTNTSLPPSISPMMSLGVPPLTDPRLTGAFPPVNQGQLQPNGSYLPSFGPTEEELQNKRLEILMQVQSALPPHARKDPRIQAEEKSFRKRDPRLQKEEHLRPKDPRLQESQSTDGYRRSSHSDEKQKKSRHPKSAGDKEKKILSLHEYKKKVSIQPPVKPESSSLYSQSLMSGAGTVDEKHYPDKSAPAIQSPEGSTSHIEDKQLDKTLVNTTDHEDIVHQPDDMARTLNELSDPDDHNLSSTEDQEEEEEEDPALADAMKKLVEYASDVTLFTEALRTLQESAEEYGDSLTNPVFLVKKIAEYIDQLAKDTSNITEPSESSNTSTVEKSGAEITKSLPNKPDKQDMITAVECNKFINAHETPVHLKTFTQLPIQPIQSPEDMDISSDHEGLAMDEDNQSIKSPDAMDISMGEECDIDKPVKEIPLENTEQDTDQRDLSPLSKAMRKTLEVYSMELNQPLPKQNLFNDGKFTLDNEPKKEGKNYSLDLDSIPLPALPKEDMEKTETDKKKMSPKLGVSFNLKKRTISPVTVASVYDKKETNEVDRDERKVKRHKSGDSRIDTKNIKISSLKAEIDIDFRTQDRDFRKPTLDSDLRKRNTSKAIGENKDDATHMHKSKSSIDMFEEQDRDERVSHSHVSVHKSFSTGTLDPSMLDRDDRMSTSRSGSPQLSSAFMNVDERSSSQAMNDCFRNIREDTDHRVHSRSQSPGELSDGNKQSQNKTATVRFENPKTDSQNSADSSLFDAYAVSKEKKTSELRTDLGDVDWRLSEAHQMGDVDLRAAPSKMLHSTGDVDLRGPFARAQSYPKPDIGFLSHTSAISTQSHYTEQYHTTAAKIENYGISKTTYESYSTSKYPIASYSAGYKHSDSLTHDHSIPPVVTGGKYPQSYTTSKPQQDSPKSGNIQNLMQNLDFSNLKNILANVQQVQPQPASLPSKDSSIPQQQAIPGLGGEDDEDKPAFCTGLSFLKSKQPIMDMDRSKYSGKARVPSDVGPPPVIPPVQLPTFKPFTITPIKPKPLPTAPPSILDVPLPVIPNKDSVPPENTLRSLFDIPMFDNPKTGSDKSNIIPGFEVPTNTEHLVEFSPVKDENPLTSSPAKYEKGKTPFKFSEEIPDRDFSSEWYEEPKSIQKHDKITKSDKRKVNWNSNSDSKTHKSKGERSQTKKKHEKKQVTESSWQTAILESMEEQELKVKFDDSMDTETDLPSLPDKDVVSDQVSPRKDDSTAEDANKDKIETAISDSKSDAIEHKQKDTELVEEKGTKIEDVFDQDPDSDDDEEALVIDLNADTSIVKDTSVSVENTEKSSSKLQEESTREEQSVPAIESRTEDSRDVILVSREPGTKVGDDGTDLEDERESEEILDDEKIKPKASDDVKSILEKTRKKMVIRLKGETKIVNPKTGKAYNESPVGSAIQVLGQSSKSSPAKQEKDPPPKFQIHPIHGIVSSESQSNPLKTYTSVPNQRRSHSPIATNISVISTIVGGAAGFRSTSPVNLMSPFGTAQNLGYNQYIHPVTGQAIQYGSNYTASMPLSQPPPHMSVTPQGLLVHNQMPHPIPMPVGNMAGLGTNPAILPPGMVQLPPFMGTMAARLPMTPISQVGIQRPSIPIQPPPPGVEIPTLGTKAKTPPPVSSIHTLVDTAKPPPSIPGLKTLVDTAKPPPQSPGIRTVVDTAKPPPPLPGLKTLVDTAKPPPALPSFTTIGDTAQTPTPTPDSLSDRKTPEPLSSTVKTSIDKKDPSDVFGWFSDKFEKRLDDNKSAFKTVEKNYQSETSAKTVPSDKTTSTYTYSQTNKEVVKTVPESDLRQIDTSYKGTPCSTSSRESRNSTSKPASKGNLISIPTESASKGNLISIPTEPASKGNLISIPTTAKVPKDTDSENQTECKKDSDSKQAESDASSELEDGEISDESADEPSPVKYDPCDHRQVVVQRRDSWSDHYPHESAAYPRQVQRVPLNSPVYSNSPKRIVNIRSGPSGYIPVLEIKKDLGHERGRRAAAEWSDMLQYPQHNPIERVKGDPPASLAIKGQGQDDASTLLSKSAASISKNKQKFVAKSQVKTLGDWLQVELEMDNIKPLESIIPYSLDTDLSIIPKARRRKIRIKVKNAIEQENNKKLNVGSQQPSQISPVNREPVTSNYIPEVDHEQIEKELSLISKTLASARAQRDSNLQNRGNFNINVMGTSPQDCLIVALSTIENEMKTILHRTCFYGYPHRRVPAELLLSSEMQSFRSQVTDVFLILMMPISTKPYHKLLQMRRELEDLHKDLLTATDKVSVQTQIRDIHSQRQAILRSFTGYLNKRRIQKVQDNVDKYTRVYEYFKHQQPPVPDSLLKYIRTTQMDLRQHLILAKQYFAMEEKKAS